MVSALGNNVSENHLALTQHKNGIGDITILPTRHRGILPAGEIKRTNEELAEVAGIVKAQTLPRSVLLSIPAIKEALDSGKLNDFSQLDFIYSTTVGGMDLSENVLGNHAAGRASVMELLQYHDCGASTRLISKLTGIQGRQFTISTACSSSANAIGMAAERLNAGRSKFVLAGGADALCRFTINGFNALLILDKNLCRPFDDARQGLNLGEGAAFLLLEREETALERNAEILGFLQGFGNTNDSFHQTASSEAGVGAMLAMEAALAQANLEAADISYINAHGTGTQNNDFSEGNAIEKLFRAVPPFASTKSYTGHTLAASGAVEAIYSILAIKHQEIYPTLRWQNKIPGHSFASFDKVRNYPVQHVMSNSLGFGGNCTSLIFSQYKPA